MYSVQDVGDVMDHFGVVGLLFRLASRSLDRDLDHWIVPGKTALSYQGG